MNFKIDTRISTIFPPLEEEEFKLLEESILKDGVRDPLVVWHEERILLDGHNRLRICQENDISFNVTMISLGEESSIHDAILWVIINQEGRRGKLPPFLSICNAFKLEPLFDEIEKDRKSKGGQKGMSSRWGYNFCVNDSGVMNFDRRKTMAKLGKCGEKLVEKIAYIRNNDRERYNDLEEKLRTKELKDVPVDPVYFKIKSVVDNPQVSKAAIERLEDRRTVQAFTKAVVNMDASSEVQKKVAQRLQDKEVSLIKDVAERTDSIEAEFFAEGLKKKKQTKKEQPVQFDAYVMDCIKQSDSLHKSIQVLLEHKELLPELSNQAAYQSLVLSFGLLLKGIQALGGFFNETEGQAFSNTLPLLGE